MERKKTANAEPEMPVWASGGGCQHGYCCHATPGMAIRRFSTILLSTILLVPGPRSQVDVPGQLMSCTCAPAAGKAGKENVAFQLLWWEVALIPSETHSSGASEPAYESLLLKFQGLEPIIKHDHY